MSDQYQDDDLVYIDPESRTVVGKVEWSENGLPKSLLYDKKEKKEFWRKFYPWGTYRSMKGAFRIDGKREEKEGAASIDDVLPQFMSDTL